MRSIALELLGIGFHAADELAREINLAGIRNIALNHKPTFEDIISNIISDIISGIDLETITKAQDISLSSVYDIASGCNIDLKKDFKNITDFNLELILKYACELDKVFKAEKDIDFNRKIRSIPNANPCRHYLLLVYAIWKLLSVIYEKAVKQVDIFKFPKRRESEKRLSREYGIRRDKTFKLYVAFVLIEERRKNNFTAWEGIRIFSQKKD